MFKGAKENSGNFSFACINRDLKSCSGFWVVAGKKLLIEVNVVYCDNWSDWGDTFEMFKVVGDIINSNDCK